jgi:hypothetical protein
LDDPNTSPKILKEVIQVWHFRRKVSSVLIAEKRSPSPQKSKSSSHLRVTLMSPSAARFAGRTEDQSVLAMVAAAALAVAHARCFPQFAHNVAKKLRYPSSLAATSRYTAEIAT